MHFPDFVPTSRRSGAACGLSLVALLSTVVLVACGGGGSDGSTSTTSTASAAYTSGAISGFGSVIVNGVRFDTSSATVEDEDGSRHSADDLRLGNSVEIESSEIDASTQTATASVIRYGSEIKGPLTAVDTTTSSFTLLGQTVEVSSTTVYDTTLSGGLSSLSSVIGSVLEVHAQYDAARQLYVASRVSLEDSADSYKLRGPILSLDTTAQTFQMGSATISYASLSPQPTGLAVNQWVRVKLSTTAASDGSWVALQVKTNERKLSRDHASAEVKGTITAWTSATSFSVNDVPVDASSASFPDGQDGVVLGARVEVKGSVTDGVLIATSVHVEDSSEEGQGEDYELHGHISSLDTTAKTFVLRGVTVSYASVSEWKDMTESDLGTVTKVEVKGSLSSDGTTLVASVISADD
jgi:hypothetical protein